MSDINSNLPVADTTDGTIGATSPTVAQQVGGKDNSGNLQALKIDANGGVVVAGEGSAGTPAGGVVSIQGVSSGTVVPVSVASLPLPSGAATEASLTKLPVAQGSTTSGESGPLIQGAVTTGSPTYTTAQTNPLSLTTAGALRTDSSATTQPISASSLPLPTGASTSALQTTGNSSLSSIDTKTPALGQALAAASVPVVLTAAQITTLTPLTSITVTQSTGTNLHTVVDTLPSIPAGANAIGSVSVSNFPATQPVSAVSLPLPTGAATETTLSALNTKITTTANGVKVDGSAVTQPISAAALPLPSGAATSALQTTTNASLSSIDAGIPAALGQTTMSASMPVVLASDQSTINTNSIPVDGTKASYSTSTSNLVSAASATDIFTITGSGSKTIRVLRIEMFYTQSSSNIRDFLLIKRSAANTGGTSSTLTNVPHDSLNSAGTATVRAYTANPSGLGAAVGTIRSGKNWSATSTGASSALIQGLIWEFGNRPAEAIVLRGTSEVLAINLNTTTLTTPTINISIEWTEE